MRRQETRTLPHRNSSSRCHNALQTNACCLQQVHWLVSNSHGKGQCFASRQAISTPDHAGLKLANIIVLSGGSQFFPHSSFNICKCVFFLVSIWQVLQEFAKPCVVNPCPKVSLSVPRHAWKGVAGFGRSLRHLVP